MPDLFLVIETANGRTVGASAVSFGAAIAEAQRDHLFDVMPLMDAMWHLHTREKSFDNAAGLTANGYTLARSDAGREGARFSDEQCDAVTAVFSKWMVIDDDDMPEIRERVRRALAAAATPPRATGEGS